MLELRKQRTQWQVEDKIKGDKKSKPKAAKAPLDATLNSILDELL